MSTWVWFNKDRIPLEFIIDTTSKGDSGKLLYIYLEELPKGKLHIDCQSPVYKNLATIFPSKVAEETFVPDSKIRNLKLFKYNYPYLDNLYVVTMPDSYFAMQGEIHLTISDVVSSTEVYVYDTFHLAISDSAVVSGDEITYEQYLSLVGYLKANAINSFKVSNEVENPDVDPSVDFTANYDTMDFSLGFHLPKAWQIIGSVDSSAYSIDEGKNPQVYAELKDFSEDEKQLYLRLGIPGGKNGKDGTNGTDGKDGTNGVGVASIVVDSDNKLTVTLTNGETYTSGSLKGDKGDQGIQGEKGDKGDQGIQGEKGDKGDQGIQGEKGEDGKDGVDGTNGESILTGHGAPSSDLGTNGDKYLDLDTYDLYEKSNGSWSKIGNIKGEQGEKGDKGDQGIQGEKGEDGTNGLTTWIAYADDSNGNGFSITDSNKSYIGFCTTIDSTQPTSPNAYNWTLFKAYSTGSASFQNVTLSRVLQNFSYKSGTYTFIPISDYSIIVYDYSPIEAYFSQGVVQDAGVKVVLNNYLGSGSNNFHLNIDIRLYDKNYQEITTYIKTYNLPQSILANLKTNGDAPSEIMFVASWLVLFSSAV